MQFSVETKQLQQRKYVTAVRKWFSPILHTSKIYELKSHIENNDIEREENVTLQNQEISPEKILLKFSQRNILVTIQEQITLKDREIRNPR